jgi:ribosomal protein S18 acetylase RimI-like enzyme
VEFWQSTEMLIRGTVIDMTAIDGFAVTDETKSGTEIIGLVTYVLNEKICEIVSLNSTRPNLGIGTILVETVIQFAKQKKCRRVQLMTTNDNINALKFYQRRGFDLVGINCGAIDRERVLKPAIPSTGHYGIPMRHELELEINLQPIVNDDFIIRSITGPEEKSKITKDIMHSLPKWFSPPSYIETSAELHRGFPFFAAATKKDSQMVGFIALKPHNPYTAEINVIGILESFHRYGLGRRLVEASCEYLKSKGYMYLTVKTLDASAVYEPYDQTRKFYSGMGFVPLEMFPRHWDEDNPCLFSVKAV